MTCDSANRVKTIEAGGATIVEDISYHPTGQVRSMRYGNGFTTTVGVDGRGRVKSIDAEEAMALRYTYDGADDVTTFDNLAVTGSGRSMTYDPLGRVSTVQADTLWGLRVYRYDELGNRTSRTTDAEISYEYDAHNRLTSTSEVPPRGSMTFRWDDVGRLVWSSDGATYRYDGAGPSLPT